VGNRYHLLRSKDFVLGGYYLGFEAGARESVRSRRSSCDEKYASAIRDIGRSRCLSTPDSFESQAVLTT
jgi:hypothetical protein